MRSNRFHSSGLNFLILKINFISFVLKSISFAIVLIGSFKILSKMVESLQNAVSLKLLPNFQQLSLAIKQEGEEADVGNLFSLHSI